MWATTRPLSSDMRSMTVADLSVECMGAAICALGQELQFCALGQEESMRCLILAGMLIVGG